MKADLFKKSESERERERERESLSTYMMMTVLKKLIK